MCEVNYSQIESEEQQTVFHPLIEVDLALSSFFIDFARFRMVLVYLAVCTS